MKVDFNVALKDSRKNDTYNTIEVIEKGVKVEKLEKVLLRDLIAHSLYAGTSLEYANDPDKDRAIKLKAYRLSEKISASEGPINITCEEVVLIRQAANGYQAAGTYAQIMNLVEEKEDEDGTTTSK